MSHSPLHQRLHFRLAMRQNLSSHTLSPLPRYPAHSPPKDGEPLAPPATSPPSLPLPPLPVLRDSALRASFPPSPTRADSSADKRLSMRATHIRPRTAPASPERPGTAYSTRSTIRQVEPSPDSLSDALTNGFADSGTPAAGISFEPFPPFDPGQDAMATEEESGTHIPSTELITNVPALKRGGTPSGHSSPRKSRSSSPKKSRSYSPRKNLIRTPTLTVHEESPSSAYSGAEYEHLEPPDTPSPVTREQQRQAYAPLRIRQPSAASGDDETAKVAGHGTHVRIADYMRKMRDSKGGRSSSPKKDAQNEQVPASTARFPGPQVPHIVQAMAQPMDQSQILSPFSKAQKQAEQPARHTSVSRRSEASGASVASKHSIFSTPGRDELERKKPIVEEDEGPFAKATSVQDLAQRRRRVSEVDKEGDNEVRKGRLCGLKCVVM